MKEPKKIPDGYWPCACVKRDRKGNMTHIKMHPPTAKKCKTCDATRPPKGWDTPKGDHR